MNEPDLSAKTDAFIEFISDLFRYRRRMVDIQAEDVHGFKEYFEKLRFGDGSRRGPEPDLFIRAGTLLSRSVEPLTMGEISKALELSLSAATRLVDSLVENGLAERADDPTDRRIVRVALTDEGRKMFEVVFGVIHKRIGEFLSHLTMEEIDQLMYLLRKAFTGLHEA